MFSTHVQAFLILFLCVMYALHSPLVVNASEDAVKVLRVQSEDVSSDDTGKNDADSMGRKPPSTSRSDGENRPVDKWDQVRQQVGKIRDARKQEVFNRIVQRLHAVNNTATDRMMGALTALTTILDKITAEAAILNDEGTDTSKLEPLLQQAHDALTLAKTAVESQAEKEYTLQLDDEGQLRQSLGDLVSQIRQDLRDTWQTVVDAKHSVRAASTELNLLTQTGI